MPPRFIALIPAAGIGARAGTPVPKQYAPIHGKPMLMHTIDAFARCRLIGAIHVVISPQDNWLESLGGGGFSAHTQFHRCGGPSRAQSVLNGLKAVGADAADWILVHDAARPFITPAMIESLIEQLRNDPVGGLLALPVADTVKRADAEGRVQETLSRDGLWLAQTPQMFRYAALRDDLETFPDVTDEASAMERSGLRPRLVRGHARNVKVTHAEDFLLTQYLVHG